MEILFAFPLWVPLALFGLAGLGAAVSWFGGNVDHNQTQRKRRLDQWRERQGD